MVRIQFVKRRAYLRQFDDLRQRLVLNFTNDSMYKFGIVAGLDNQHQTHRRLFEFNGCLRIRELRAINDIGPMDEIVKIGHGAIKDSPRNVRYEFRTRLVAWIVEFM